ncbi:NAD-dependent epimerase [Actinoallomurus iriomotensis]|uniref:NAD-dependent epimerase n=2 Tax=Actinoallomurus iriomotensis TaxID=478107 RepID=A0A9W6W477_9ACTN|nr:NAD-dependent epimerase [Actinoallomurus iriomotensis]
MKIVLAGGSGALGRRIAADLTAAGHEVVVLTRSPRESGAYRQVGWDGVTVGPWATELAGAVLINLAGAIVDRRPTASAVELLTRSRVEPTRALAEAATAALPAVWVQMSTLAIYGDGGERIIDETAAPAEGPPQMAGVARAWEAAAEDAPAGRQVILRTAVVLDRDTPALDRLAGLTRWGLGGRIGTGRQWVSWLHIADLLAIIRRCLSDPEMTGVVHATSPNPVRNADLMAALRRTMRRPAAPPTPAALVRVGSLLLRTDPALALTGRRCVPTRLRDAGFAFAYPDLPHALEDLLTRRTPSRSTAAD